MQHNRRENGPVMRLFQVHARKGCADELLGRFATTSADVVRQKPGNEGYLFGRGVAVDDDIVHGPPVRLSNQAVTVFAVAAFLCTSLPANTPARGALCRYVHRCVLLHSFSCRGCYTEMCDETS